MSYANIELKKEKDALKMIKEYQKAEYKQGDIDRVNKFQIVIDILQEDIKRKKGKSNYDRSRV